MLIVLLLCFIWASLGACFDDAFVDENYNNLDVIDKVAVDHIVDTSYYAPYDPPPPPAPTTNNNEINFLSQLYDATDGANWLWKTSTTDVAWSFVGTPNPCGNAWQGITCLNCNDGDTCSITGIDLSGYNLVGRINNLSNIVYMTALTNLTLSNNRISGSIPTTFNYMTALQSITLSSNFLSGPVALNFTNLKALQIFDVGHNFLTGPFPIGIGTMRTLSIEYNQFSGAIPYNVNIMTGLQTMTGFSNAFTNTIPASFGEMPSLQYLSFGDNSLMGTIPTEISDLGSLEVVQFGHNMLGGPFPSVFLDCASLRILDMSDNSFTGRIPSNIDQNAGLSTLNFDFNKFTGEIPNSFASFTSLYQVGFAGNNLQGVLPATLYTIPTLKYISLSDNELSGSVSSSVSNLNNLISFGVADNRMTGEIPSELCNLVNLQELSFQTNFFGGEIPECLGDLVSMQHFSLNTNQFVGQIPSNFGKLTALISLSVQDNRFTGPLPSELGGLSSLLGFFVEQNFLTGTLSSGIGNAVNLTALVANNNYLTGEVPSSLVNLKNLTLMQINTNSFEGTVPELISQLINLETLLLYSNKFSGGLSEAFSVDQTDLSTIDISENNFNGPIPSAVFSLPNLKIISAVKNCFTGSLPEEMCNAVNLENIDFDGIASGEACIEERLGFLSAISGNSVYTSTYITGSIPQCLFSLPNLQSLHLSGNGIESSLPDIPANSKITNISLPFNRIYGTIPVSIQKWGAMKYIDLSSNYLSGTIDQMDNYTLDGVNATVIKLQTNRLSGYLPSYFRSALSINVLTGNVFQCDLDKSSLPRNDPNFEEYSCGSIVLDTTINFALLVIGALLIIGAYVIARQYYIMKADIYNHSPAHDSSRVTGDVSLDNVGGSKKPRTRSFARSFSDRVSLQKDEFMKYMENRIPKAFNNFSFAKMIHKSDSVPQTSSLFYVLKSARNLSVFLALIAVFIFMPLSLLFKTAWNKKYSTHSYDYGWVISLAYLQGIPPAVTIMIVWGGVLVVIHAIITEIDEERIVTKLLFMHATSGASGSNNNGTNSVRDTVSVMRDTGTAVNDFNMLRASVKFPNSNRSGNSSSENVISSAIADAEKPSLQEYLKSLCGFSVPFTSIYAYCVNFLIVVTANGLYVYVSLTQNTVLSIASLILLVAFKLYWNMKVIPLLLHSKKKQSASSKGTALAHCVLLIFNNVVAPCLATAAADTSCFSLFLIAPNPIDTEFTYPICRAYDHNSCLSEGTETVYTEFEPPFIYSYQCTSSILTRYVPLFLIMFCFTGIVLPCMHTYARISLANRDYWIPDETHTLYSLVRKLEKYTCLIISGVHWPIREVTQDSQRLELMNYKIRSITCNIIGSMAVCLTFGLAYPPLALVVLIYIFSASSILRSIVQEHLNECDAHYYDLLCRQLENESYGIAALLQRSSFALLSHSATFCFFLLIDISNGFVCSSLLLILTISICVAYTCGGRNAHSTSLGTDSDSSYFFNANYTDVSGGEVVTNNPMLNGVRDSKGNMSTSKNSVRSGNALLDYKRQKNNVQDVDDERMSSVDTIDIHIAKQYHRNNQMASEFDYNDDDNDIDDIRGSSIRLSTLSKCSK